MALAGFPDVIDVTLGGIWNGRFGLSASSVISLTKVSGQPAWSEDGTNTYNKTTNRLLVTFLNTDAFTQYGSVVISAGTQGTTNPAGFVNMFHYKAYTTGGTIFDAYD